MRCLVLPMVKELAISTSLLSYASAMRPGSSTVQTVETSETLAAHTLKMLASFVTHKSVSSFFGELKRAKYGQKKVTPVTLGSKVNGVRRKT